jgi:hypothetical protein
MLVLIQSIATEVAPTVAPASLSYKMPALSGTIDRLSAHFARRPNDVPE